MQTIRSLTKNKNLILFLLVVVLMFFGYAWFSKQPAFDQLIEYAAANTLQYFLVIVVVKIIGIVWPPVSGGIVTLGSVPVIGWELAYLADFTGGTIGTIIAYTLGKRYGLFLLQKLFDDSVIARIRKIEIKKGKEFEAIFLLRLFTAAVSEAISYGAGFLRIPFKQFLLGSILSGLAYAPVFYVTSMILDGNSILPGAILIVIFGGLFYKLRSRYFM